MNWRRLGKRIALAPLALTLTLQASSVTMLVAQEPAAPARPARWWNRVLARPVARSANQTVVSAPVRGVNYQQEAPAAKEAPAKDAPAKPPAKEPGMGDMGTGTGDMGTADTPMSAQSPSAAAPTTSPSASTPQSLESQAAQQPSTSSLLQGTSAAAGAAGSATASAGASAGITAATQSNPSAPSTVLSTAGGANAVAAGALGGAVAAASATSTGALLDQVASVSVRRTSAINLDPRVRGFHSEQVVATANGMNQLKTRIDIDSLFSQIDPGIVNNVTVIDGPYSSLYGPGFAFLISELSPVRRYEEPEGHIAMTLGHGSNGREIYDRQTVWGGGNRWGFIASYGLRTGNDYDPGAETQDSPVPASFQKWDGFIAVGLDVTPSSKLEFNYLRNEQNHVELPGVAYDITNQRNDQFNVRYIIQEDPEGPQQLLVQYWWNRTPYHGDASRNSKQQSFITTFVTPAFAGIPISNVVANGALQSTGARAIATWGEKDSVQLTVGADWRRYQIAYRERDFNAAGLNAFGLTSVFGIPESSMEDYGVLTNLLVPISETFSVTVGGRVDWTRAFLNQNDPVLNNDAFTNVTNPTGTSINPVVGTPNEMLGMGYITGAFKINEQQTINLGAAYAMRNPSLAELYTDQPFVPLVRFGNSFVNGNSELTPERNLQFDAGVTHRDENLFMSIRGFYSDVENYILASPTIGRIQPIGAVSAPGSLNRQVLGIGIANNAAVSYDYNNIARASFYGGDASAEVRILSWLSVGGNLAYVRGTNHSPQQAVLVNGVVTNIVSKGAEGIPGIFPFNGAFAIRVYDPNEEENNWGIDFIGRLVHGQEYLADSLGELATPGYSTFDVRAFVRLFEGLRVTTAVENIFDRSYTEHGSLAIVNAAGNITFVKEPGINWRVGVEWEY